LDGLKYETHVRQGKAQPGLYLVLKPEEKAYPTVRRVARQSPGERTAKDFVDLFGNVGVLHDFGPAGAEHVADSEQWRELVPQEHRDLEAVREIYTGGKEAQLFTVVFLLEESNRAGLSKWKELVSRIIEKFF